MNDQAYTYSIEFWKGYKILCAMDLTTADYIHDNPGAAFRDIKEELNKLGITYPERTIFRDSYTNWYVLHTDLQRNYIGSDKKQALEEAIKSSF